MTENPLTILLVGCPPAIATRIPVLLAAVDRGRYRCETVPGVEQGVARVAEKNVDLVLFNLAPPSRGGLTDFLRARTQMLNRPIVVVTSPEHETLAIEAVQRGAQDYVLASSLLDAKQLARTLNGALEGHRLNGDTERQTRDQQVSEANFYQMIHSNADGMVIVDRTGTVCFVNPAAETLLARPAKGMIGGRFEFSSTPGKTEEFDIIQNGAKVRTVEMRVVETLWEGKRAHLASLRDISERKRLEVLKDEFVGKVSHELRTPMTSIKGAVTLMLERSLGEINAEQEDFLKTISHDIDRLAELINNVLDLSKMEAGKMAMNRQRLDAAGIIDQACRSYQTILGKRTIVRRYEDVPRVYVDRNLILQVIANLLGNAIKFTKDEGTITLSVRADNDMVMIGVSDDGPGMPKEMLGKLFQKFVQADSPPAEDRPTGTGLGLAICREIIQLHEGRIWVESEPGHGSTFAFSVPAYEPEKTFNVLVQGMKETALADQAEFGLLVISLDGAAAGEAMASLEEMIRNSAGRRDHVIPFEATSLAVLAVTDAAGAEAMRKRLAERCVEWSAGKSVTCGIGASVFPKDGDTSTALVQRAKARATEDRRSGQDRAAAPPTS